MSSTRCTQVSVVDVIWFCGVSWQKTAVTVWTESLNISYDVICYSLCNLYYILNGVIVGTFCFRYVYKYYITAQPI